MKKFIWVVIIVLLVLLGVFFYFKRTADNGNKAYQQPLEVTATSTSETQLAVSPTQLAASSTQREEKNDFGILYQDKDLNFSFYYPENNWYIKKIGDPDYRDGKIAIAVEYKKGETVDEINKKADEENARRQAEYDALPEPKMGTPGISLDKIVSNNGKSIYIEYFRGEGSLGPAVDAYFDIKDGVLAVSYYFNPIEEEKVEGYQWNGQYLDESHEEAVANKEIYSEFLEIIKTLE